MRAFSLIRVLIGGLFDVDEAGPFTGVGDGVRSERLRLTVPEMNILSPDREAPDSPPTAGLMLCGA
jgi:hypothetical protein